MRSFVQYFSQCLGCVLLFSISIQSSANSQDAETFTWNFKKGDSFNVEFDQQVEQTTEVINKPIKMVTDIKMKMIWEVTDVTRKGNALIKQSFKHIKLDWKSIAIESDRENVRRQISFDSNSQESLKGAEKQIAATLKPLLDASYNVEMSSLGEVVNVTLDKKVMEAIRAVPDSMIFRKLFTKNGIGSTIKQSVIAFPKDTKTAANTTWQQVTEFTSPAGTAKYTQDFKVIGSDATESGDQTKIEVSGTAELVQPKSKDGKETKQEFKENGLTGKLRFDTKNGNLIDSEVTQKIVSATPYREMVINVGTSNKLKIKMSRNQ